MPVNPVAHTPVQSRGDKGLSVTLVAKVAEGRCVQDRVEGWGVVASAGVGSAQAHPIAYPIAYPIARRGYQTQAYRSLTLNQTRTQG